MIVEVMSSIEYSGWQLNFQINFLFGLLDSFVETKDILK